MLTRVVLSKLLLLFVASCSNYDLEVVAVDEGPLKYEADSEYPGTQSSELFVFVGEKIEIVEFRPPHGEVWMDSAYDAKYRILEPIYGDFQGNVIEFRAFDHYGFPPFGKFQNVLLFVSKEKGKLYHEKYVFHDVYRTSNGKWASCGDPYLRAGEYHRKSFTPKPLDFATAVVFDRSDLSDEQFQKIFTPPYFDVQGKKATCKMGAYVDELFAIERDGVLKARGLF